MKHKSLAIKFLSLLTPALAASAQAPAAPATDPAKAPVPAKSAEAKAAPQKAENFQEMFTKGQADGQIRLRYEYVDQENGKPHSWAATSRLRLGFRTAEIGGLSFYGQGHANLTPWDEYSDGRQGKNSTRDIIADPDGFRLHQLYADMKWIPDTLVRVGRQEINLDDQRFVGSIDWRQNGQSFDGILVQNKSVDKLTLTAAYLTEIQTILLKPTTDLSHGSNELNGLGVLHARYNYAGKHNISAFAYLLDCDADNSVKAVNGERIERDNITEGLRLDGSFDIDAKNAINYDVMGALQQDFNGGNGGHDGEFLSAYLAYEIEKKYSLGGGYSYISGAEGSGANYGFDTLAGTAHKFNGWADLFTSTNGGAWKVGLQDLWIDASVKVDDVGKFTAAYHWFYTANDFSGAKDFDGHLGDEIDLMWSRDFVIFGQKINALAKYGYYFADEETGNPTSDKQIVWAQLEYKF
ncbi:MAG: hypothetical protein RL095_434 [Verrucomicrobiota bacterium]|jgi:hypothetical protein